MDHHKNLKSYLTLHGIDYADHGSLGFKAFSTYAPGKQNIIDIDLASKQTSRIHGRDLYKIKIESHVTKSWEFNEELHGRNVTFLATIEDIRAYLLYRPYR